MWRSLRFGGVGLTLVSCFYTHSASSASPGGVQRYVAIVGSNASDEKDVPPLEYADDDAAKYYDIFRALGAKVALLTVLDPAAQRRFPDAARAALPPTRKQLSASVKALFDRAHADRDAGYETHFLFIYTGHGNIGPNRQGYINLLDGRFFRSDLYREIVAPSPANFNHLVLDSCQASSFVRKKGNDKAGHFAAAVSAFVLGQDLTMYPNTGVIFAASDAGRTLESPRWESGIFSHELRSAFVGPADVNEDGRITYAEAAAFVGAANTAVPATWARLNVFYRPPPLQDDVPLIDLSAFRVLPSLAIPPALAGRYHVEDARGVRMADVNSSPEQTTRISLVGQGPFLLMTSDQSAQPPVPILAEIPNGTQVDVRGLTFVRGLMGRGETELEQQYFRVPFGIGFYRGVLDSQRTRRIE